MRLGRVAVVGGSIAGCAAALAVARAGAEQVVVFERAQHELQGRGVGVAMHAERYAELESLGYLDADIPWVRVERRAWVVRDGERRAGRRIGDQPFGFRTYNWGSLWQGLRNRIPESVEYRAGAGVAEVLAEPDGALLRLADGTEERFDLVVGADGYRSLVRAAIEPQDRAQYGGYLAWRGTVPVELLPDAAEAFPELDAATVVFPGGHMIVYRIPGPGGTGEDINYVLYTTPEHDSELNFDDPEAASGRGLTESLRRQELAIAERHFPPFWQDVIRLTPPDKGFIQPMYEMAAARYACGRLVLLGDAATVARPHTGSGAVKALQDAGVLERALRSAATVEDGLADYDAERAPVGQAMLQLGQRLGVSHVQQTPDWSGMDQQGLDAWWQTAGGQGFGGHALRKA
ncbi:FAD-dependent monooxygenase [Kitasatospora azatica]|uniref:FAD-dependent monooxygenase n=1 Tax=Kitasatospora azatica TaxID=58347 RepID=UPI00068C1BA8|nr:FAD-dependent monooxygenase [Kitasatospora azatica]